MSGYANKPRFLVVEQSYSDPKFGWAKVFRRSPISRIRTYIDVDMIGGNTQLTLFRGFLGGEAGCRYSSRRVSSMMDDNGSQVVVLSAHKMRY